MEESKICETIGCKKETAELDFNNNNDKEGLKNTGVYYV